MLPHIERADWPARPMMYRSIGDVLFQVNVPRHHDGPEFEVVAMRNGRVVSAVTCEFTFDRDEAIDSIIRDMTIQIDAYRETTK